MVPEESIEQAFLNAVTLPWRQVIANGDLGAILLLHTLGCCAGQPGLQGWGCVGDRVIRSVNEVDPSYKISDCVPFRLEEPSLPMEMLCDFLVLRRAERGKTIGKIQEGSTGGLNQ